MLSNDIHICRVPIFTKLQSRSYVFKTVFTGIHRPVLSDELSSSFQLRTSSKQVEWISCYKEVLCSADVCALIITWLVNVDV